MLVAPKAETDGAHELLTAPIWGPFEHEQSEYLREVRISEEMKLLFRLHVMLWMHLGELYDGLELGDVHSIAE